MLGRDPRDSVALARLAERYALPVIPYQTRYFALSSDHPMFQGSAPGPLLAPGRSGHRLRCGRSMAAVEGGAPIRCTHRADRRGPVAPPPADAGLSVRPDHHRDVPVGAGGFGAGARLACHAACRRLATPGCGTGRAACTKPGGQRPNAPGRPKRITLPWLNHCLREIVDADTKVINEYSFQQEHCPLHTPGSLFAVSSAGGLGWGFPASLGVKLASPEQPGRFSARRRRLHVCQSDGLSLHGADAETAGVDHHL